MRLFCVALACSERLPLLALGDAFDLTVDVYGFFQCVRQEMYNDAASGAWEAVAAAIPGHEAVAGSNAAGMLPAMAVTISYHSEASDAAGVPPVRNYTVTMSRPEHIPCDVAEAAVSPPPPPPITLAVLNNSFAGLSQDETVEATGMTNSIIVYGAVGVGGLVALVVVCYSLLLARSRNRKLRETEAKVEKQHQELEQLRAEQQELKQLQLRTGLRQAKGDSVAGEAVTAAAASAVDGSGELKERPGRLVSGGWTERSERSGRLGDGGLTERSQRSGRLGDGGLTERSERFGRHGSFCSAAPHDRSSFVMDVMSERSERGACEGPGRETSTRRRSMEGQATAREVASGALIRKAPVAVVDMHNGSSDEDETAASDEEEIASALHLPSVAVELAAAHASALNAALGRPSVAAELDNTTTASPVDEGEPVRAALGRPSVAAELDDTTTASPVAEGESLRAALGRLRALDNAATASPVAEGEPVRTALDRLSVASEILVAAAGGTPTPAAAATLPKPVEPTPRTSLRTSRTDNSVEGLPVVDMAQLEMDAVMGTGRIGRVYCATYHSQQCVVRRLDQAIRSLYSTEELKVETRALSALRHPHLLRIIGLVVETSSQGIQSAGTLMLAVPHSLSALLSECAERPLMVRDPHLAAKVAFEVAEGLAHLHSHGFLHGSLWPRNVLLGGAENIEVRLSDFGRSKRLIGHLCEQGSATQASATDFDQLFQPYAAPEQLSGEKWTASADIYSLGCLLARMGMGAPLFAAELREAPPTARWPPVFHKLCCGQVSVVEQMREAARQPGTHLPPPLIELVEQCTALERRQRPQVVTCLRSLKAQARLLREEAGHVSDEAERRRAIMVDRWHAALKASAGAKNGNQGKTTIQQVAQEALARQRATQTTTVPRSTCAQHRRSEQQLMIAPGQLPSPAIAAAVLEREGARTHRPHTSALTSRASASLKRATLPVHGAFKSEASCDGGAATSRMFAKLRSAVSTKALGVASAAATMTEPTAEEDEDESLCFFPGLAALEASKHGSELPQLRAPLELRASELDEPQFQGLAQAAARDGGEDSIPALRQDSGLRESSMLARRCSRQPSMLSRPDNTLRETSMGARLRAGLSHTFTAEDALEDKLEEISMARVRI